MTPRQRVWAALRGELADRVPLTCYANLLPRGEVERRLRDEGLALVVRCPVFSTSRPNVAVRREEFFRNGRRYVRQTFRTPVGEVSELFRTGGGYGTSLRCQFLIKRPEDYDVVEFIVRDEVYTPNYERFLAEQRTLGEDGVVIGNLGYSPLQQMLVLLMGPERFAIDLRERPKRFFALYETIAERQREQFLLATQSPAQAFIYGDNITSEMVGLERFARYCAPRYNEFAALLHERNKLLGVHMDGKLKHLAHAVAECDIDFVEAFAPFPDGDLPLAEARRAWPDKVIWINFPSPVHLQPPAKISEHVRQMLRDVAPGARFLVGVTENIPEHVWQQSMCAISRVLKEEGRLPLPA